MKILFLTLVAFIIAVLSWLAFTLMTFDVNAYREDIAHKLSTQMGRMVHIQGPLRLNVVSGGLSLTIDNASISNPSWASRPDFAGIGHFELGVGLWPLLHHRLAIKSLQIVNADILLESVADRRRNWDFPAFEGNANDNTATDNSESLLAIQADHVSVKDSQVAIVTADGKKLIFKTIFLTLGQTQSGTSLQFKGLYDEHPLSVAIETDAHDLASPLQHALVVQSQFGSMSFHASGTISLGQSKLAFDKVRGVAGSSTITGALLMDWSGLRPKVVGNMKVDQIIFADVSSTDSSSSSTDDTSSSPSARTYLLKSKPFHVDTLRLADVDIEFLIDNLSFKAFDIAPFQGRLLVTDGILYLSPFHGLLGKSALDGQFNLSSDAISPRMGLSLLASGINLSDLLKAGGLEAFLAAKVNLAINIISQGSDLRTLASNLSGTFSLVGAGGDVISKASDQIAAGFASLLLGGTDQGDQALNCLVARFTASGGVIRDNGIILDTTGATVAGFGGFDLRDEAMDLTFRAKPKQIDIEGLLPSFHLGGTFLQPTYNVGTPAVIQNVLGWFTGAQGLDSVPSVNAIEGQNACLAALGTSGSSVLPNVPQPGAVQTLTGKAGQLLHGMMGP